MARLERVATVETPASAPRYELRLRRRGPADAEYAIWQLPAAATPHVAAPIRVAGLAGRNLQAIASPDVATGFEIGVRNARGVHRRGLDEGGVQERALSAKYRAYAERLTFDYPYVANILERIAEAYDWEAEREDSEVLRRKRLQY